MKITNLIAYRVETSDPEAMGVPQERIILAKDGIGVLAMLEDESPKGFDIQRIDNLGAVWVQDTMDPAED